MALLKGECLSRLLPRFKRRPVAPNGSRWLPMAPDGCCSYKHTLLLAPNGSQWLPMALIDFHRVSLLPNHYPKMLKEFYIGELVEDAAEVAKLTPEEVQAKKEQVSHPQSHVTRSINGLLASSVAPRR